MSSPTQRSLKYLRDAGYLAEVTERWNQHARIRQDLFGFVDILAVGPFGTLAVQTTSAPNVSARVKKIKESIHLPRLLKAGWLVEVHGWKKGQRGDPKIVSIGESIMSEGKISYFDVAGEKDE